MQNIQNIRPRKRRSEKMTPGELEALKQYVDSFPTKYDACLDLGLSRVSLNGLLARGTGKPDTLALVRGKLPKPDAQPQQ